MNAHEECRATFEELSIWAQRDQEIHKKLWRDDRALQDFGWVRLKNGSYIPRSSLTGTPSGIKSTFYFSAYRQLADNPTMITKIMEYLRPEEENE